MPRISPINTLNLPLAVRETFDDHVNDHNTPINNMKATLGHSLQAFSIYTQWYSLYEKVKQITSERAANLYAWSVSNSSNSAICTAYFRKAIIDSGENPEDLVLNEYENKLLDFGSAIAQYKGCIANHVYNEVAQYHNNEEMVVLVAFAGQIIANNIFNNVIETEVDEYLSPYLPAKFLV